MPEFQRRAMLAFAATCSASAMLYGAPIDAQGTPAVRICLDTAAHSAAFAEELRATRTPGAAMGEILALDASGWPEQQFVIVEGREQRRYLHDGLNAFLRITP